LLGVLAPALLARPARAQEEPEALIRQGVEMRRRGDDLKAHGYFQRAYDLARTPRVAAQLGFADLAIADNLAAEQHLSEALRSIDPWVAQNRTLIETSRDKARKSLGVVTLRGAPDKTTVEVANHPAIPLPADATVWVPAGGAELRFAAPNREPWTRQVTVATGATATLEVEAPPARPPAAPEAGGPPVAPPPAVPLPVPPEPSDRSWQRTAGWAAGGAGVVLVAGGVGALLIHASKINDFNGVTNAPNAKGQCDKSLPNAGGGPCQGLLDSANSWSTLAVVGFVAGGAALAGAVVLHLTAPRAGAHGETTAACFPGGTTGLSCALTTRF
jgi:hypothetical protein